MFQDFLAQLHTLVSGLEPWQQVLALVPAGAIPFIESYFGSFLGAALGIHPAIAIPAAVVGNLISTFAAIALSSRARDAVTGGRSRRRGGIEAGPGAETGHGVEAEPGVETGPGAEVERTPKPSRFRAKIAAALDRYGVPGVSLLGPFVVASQLSGPTLVALGATRGKVYLWMGISIIAWGVVFGLFGSLFLAAII